jgi:glycosyltransferase involved in cell wall biosynthesis
MNILFLDQFSDLGGAQRCLLDLLPAVRERGWRAHVAAPGDGCLRPRAVALGAEFHAIECGPYESGRKSARDLVWFASELPGLARKIRLLVRETEAEIVYVNGPRLLPAASFSRAPLVFHCHSCLGKGYAAALAGASLSGATVIGSCRFVLEPLRPYVESGQTEVVYNGIDKPQRTTVDAPQRACPPVQVGVVGRIAPEKGQLTFVEAARMLPNCRFVICGAPLFGDRAATRYFDRVRDSATGLPVEFTGWCDDVGSVLSGLDLLVVPSAPGEATTRVILEAYAAGVPVVASASGGIPEIVRDGETGFLVQPANPARLAARIREALADPARLRIIAANAYTAWREHFTLGEYQRRILNILERVGSRARA